MSLSAAFFERPVEEVAADLVGATLLVGGAGGVIVETEAYARDDEASHSYIGPTARNAPMFGPAGCAYVYRIYGLHWCLNFTCGGGTAVLIRALEPTHGLAEMMRRRGLSDARTLCSGPAKLCQALGVDAALNGRPLTRPPFDLAPRSGRAPVIAGPRIGISRAVHTPWRFGLCGSRFLSRPMRQAES
jgi:DNA-3-methyladenine glycosylase